MPQFYTAATVGGTPVGFAWLTPQEYGLVNSRHCAFGRSIIARALRYPDFALMPPDRSWHHVDLGRTLLDSYHIGSAGWWHVTRDNSKKLAFGCMPATVMNEQGVVVWRQ